MSNESNAPTKLSLLAAADFQKRATLWLFLLAVAVYLDCLPNDFTQDDFYYILANESIRKAPGRLIGQGYGSDLYRPLGTLSYAANYALGGFHPFGFHLVNLLLHGAVTALLYGLLRELLDRSRAALGAALLFAVHPIHTEAVAAAVGRAELLAAGFVLGAWLLHLRKRPWLAALAFFLAMLSKESAVAFLALAPLGDYIRRGGDGASPLRRRFPLTTSYLRYAGAFAVYLALRWKAVGRLGISGIHFLDNPLAGLPPLWRVPNALHVAWKYLELQVMPVTLSSEYSFNAIPVWRSWKDLLPAVLATAALLALWLWSARRHPSAFLAGGIYLAGFAVSANVLFPIGTIMAERLAYLPSAGLCLLAGVGWDWAVERRRKAATVALALVTVALAARTVIRTRDWRNNFTLYASAASASPGSVKARHDLGVAYKNRGELDKARSEFAAAGRIYPGFANLLGSLGLVYARRGDWSSAEQYFEEALQLSSPGDPNYKELAAHYAEARARNALARQRRNPPEPRP